MKKEIKKCCGNCRLYNNEKKHCSVAVLINGKQYHMPVSPEDNCHMEELGIEINQVRWWVEDPKTGEPTDGDGVVKIEYPAGFFGSGS